MNRMEKKSEYKGWVEMRESEFSLFKELIYSESGINIEIKKKRMLESRLQKILKSNGFGSFHSYYDHIVQDRSGKALAELENHVSTNLTFFLREKEHYDFLIKTALPEIIFNKIEAKDYDLRIWSAGCSTGEEPYTIIMLMKEYMKSDYSSFDAGVLATDISTRALTAANKGIYTLDKIKDLPDKLLKKYFRKISTNEWEVTEEIKKEVTFRRFNLMTEKFPFKKPFDIIFCRNVMIYFDPPTKEQLVKKFYDSTSNGGYLFIGHSESLKIIKTDYKYMIPAVYQK
jgi:chemotaxis protein methyltransferase CheR